MAVVDTLSLEFRNFLEYKFIKKIIGGVIFLNPVAQLPQLWLVLTAPNIEGISLFMFVIFACIQIAVMLEGIRVRSAPMFWSMLISVIESITIITAILIRG